MIEIDQRTVIVATMTWLEAIRREAIKRNSPIPVPTWESLTPEEKGAIMRPIRSALRASDPKNVSDVFVRLGVSEQ